MDEDFYEPQALTLHIACQVELQETNTLFYLAHRLVDADPKRAVSFDA